MFEIGERNMHHGTCLDCDVLQLYHIDDIAHCHCGEVEPCPFREKLKRELGGVAWYLAAIERDNAKHCFNCGKSPGHVCACGCGDLWPCDLIYPIPLSELFYD